MLVLIAVLLVKILVASAGGSLIAAYSVLELSESETSLRALYRGMIIYGLLTICLSTVTAYFLYQRTFKIHRQSLMGLIVMIGVTAFMLGAQLLSNHFHYWGSAPLSDFAEGALWIPEFLVLSNVLLLAVALLDKKNRNL